MKINIDRVISRLEEIYQCGKQDDGTYTRMAYSKEDIKGRETFMNYFRNLGLTPRIDAAGNIVVRKEGKNPSLPSIMMGSHLDTVPDGGRYDGVVGCIGGLEVLETLTEAGYETEHPLEVVVFTDEEGFRFGNGLLGSSAICGINPEIHEDDQDINGEKRSDVMKSYGITVDRVEEAKREPQSVHCFLELHVEQGASLYGKGIPIGIVSSIAGVSRYEITIEGEANHAGSTMMKDRKDALVAAAGFIRKVPQIVEECGNEYTVATVGTMKVVPNSVNVVPGSCTFNLEIRDQDAKVISQIEKKAKEYLKELEEKHEFSCKLTAVSYHKPAPMSDWVKEKIECAVKEEGYEYTVIPSGAFHDSLIMTEVFPTGMIFVPSIGGISHSRYENTDKEDIQKGCNVLLQTVLGVDCMN